MTHLTNNGWNSYGPDYTSENPVPEDVMQKFTLDQARALKAHDMVMGYRGVDVGDCEHTKGIDTTGWTSDDYDALSEKLIYDDEVHFSSWDADECCFALPMGLMCADEESETCEHQDKLYWERDEFWPRISGKYREDEA